MTRLGDDLISAPEIPSVHILCQGLGFDTTASQRKFRESVTNWRKTYKTASGKSGTALLDWDSDIERHNLGVMAQRFVETGSTAHDFWPSDGGTSSQVKPRYPKDEFTILVFLRRFMWRQNHILAKNTKQKKKHLAFYDDSSSVESWTSADYFPPTSPRKLQHSQPLQDQVPSKPAEDSSIVKVEPSYPPTHGLPLGTARMMGGLPLKNQNRHRRVQSHQVEGNLGRPITSEGMSDENFERRNSLAESERSHMHHLSGRPPSMARMVSPSPKTLAGSTGTPSNFLPGSANSAQRIGSFDATLTKGSDLNDEAIMQGQISGQKRHHLRRSDSDDVVNEPIKRSRLSKPTELVSNQSHTITDKEDLASTPVLPRSTIQGRKPIILTFKRSHGSPASPTEISPLVLPDNDNTHSTSLQTPTSELDSSNKVNDQRIHPQKIVEFGNSNSPHSQTFPSPKELDPSITAKADLPAPTVRPEVEMFVVALFGSQITIKKWPGGTLRGRTLKSIFNEVTTTFSEQNLQRIRFQLQTLKKENGMECLIERNDDRVFEVMIQEFNERIKERKRAGETRFKLFLKPDYGLQGATEVAVSEGSESEEDYL